MLLFSNNVSNWGTTLEYCKSSFYYDYAFEKPLVEEKTALCYYFIILSLNSVSCVIKKLLVLFKLSGKYGIPAPWYFPFKASFWADLCCSFKSNNRAGRGLLFTNIMQKNQPAFFDDKGKGTGQKWHCTMLSPTACCVYANVEACPLPFDLIPTPC